MLEAHDFRVPPEAKLKLKNETDDVLVECWGKGVNDSHVREFLPRLRKVCKSAPEAYAGEEFRRQVLQVNNILRSLPSDVRRGIDPGERSLLANAVFMPGAQILTSDNNFVVGLHRVWIQCPDVVAEIASIQGRICTCDEMFHLVLAWKPYEEIKSGLHRGQWRNPHRLSAVFQKDGLDTPGDRLVEKCCEGGKSDVSMYAPLLSTSW